MLGPKDDLDLLITAAEKAGDIATLHFQNDPETWNKGAEGPVTEADLAIDTMLRQTLLAARPDYGWLSEETEDGTGRLGAEHVFICDPIDGTRAFIEGQRSFAHSLAVTRSGQVTAAVVYLPMQDIIYVAARGYGATKNGSPVHVSCPASLSASTLLTTKANLDRHHWPNGLPQFGRSYRPSLAYRMSLVGEGRFDGMMTFRPTWEWDIAAGTLIVEEAGGIASTGRGQPLMFNTPDAQVDGVLAGAPNIHAELVAARNQTPGV